MTMEIYNVNLIFFAGIWFPLNGIFAVYLGAEILRLKKKWYLMSIYILLGVIYEIVIFLDPQGFFINVFPPNPGEDLIGGYFRTGSFAFFLEIIFLGSLFFFLGFAFLFKGLQSEGIKRKKYFFLAIGDFMTAGFGAFEIFSDPGILIVFTRSLTTIGFFLKYLGVKEESVEQKKKHRKKEISIEDSLFRLSNRPERITEEEVSFHKEKKICLVCKGKLSKFNIFICDCDILYCENCARALSELENMCWVCNAPIDESKPVKQYPKEETDPGVLSKKKRKIRSLDNKK